MREYKKAKQQLEILVENFDNHINEYKKGNYNETLTRRDFIDPFLSALGWDVDNKLNLPGSYREVIHEDKLLIDDSSRAPDYCITINGNKKFYVEAKKPSVSLKDSISAAYQLRRYGWSAKMPISIITDFEEFSIYDCQVRPNADDKASIARINYFTYQDYIKEFDFLWETFSKEMVKNGSLEKYFQSTKGKRASTSVDEEFLKSLDSWRDLLARNLVFKNPSINEDQLNFSLQKIIDRIIFLRISEDRDVEDQNQLLKSIGNNTYNNLKTLFHLADRKYNSGLFDFKKDEITDSLIIDDNILGQIIEEMYYPKSPYEFSVIPVEILGHSYEQYLGKTITIETNHAIKIEEKPEVRKAGGVYYTPQYIVGYIVKNTVGKLIEDKKPDEVSKIKICDPACGSGSFLLGAYQYLLDWHREYYYNSKLKNKGKYITPDGNLTTSLKKEILLNNIFGVDIDTNAVEVTKLSLMLKAMEGETKASINHQLSAFHDRVLPTLDNNIKSGNSLIDMDFYESQIDFEPTAEKKIKPFNWEQAFPSVFKQGGFDAVIGNPPYVDSEEMVKSNLILREYCNQKYLTAKGNWDLYCVFSEKSVKLLKDKGWFGFITPNKFLSAPYGDILKLFYSNYNIKKIADFSSVTVFVSNNKKINVYPIILILNKIKSSKEGKYQKFIQDDILKLNYEKKISIAYGDIKWSERFDTSEEITQKIVNSSSKINEYFTIENSATVSEAYLIKENLKELKSYKDFNSTYFKFVNTGTIDRFSCNWGINKTQYIKNSYNYPVIKKDELKKLLPKRYESAKKSKLVLAGMVKVLEAIYDDGSLFPGKSTTIIMNKNNKFDLKYLMGLINSKLYSFIFTTFNKYNTMSGGYMNVGKNQLDEFIFKEIDFNNNNQTKIYNKIIDSVNNLLLLSQNLQSTTLPEQKEQIQQRIIYTDKKIDQLVYELYGLTEEEIKVVEGE